MAVPHGAKVLLVDDDKELTFIIRAHLVAAGYVVEEVHDGEAAVERAKSFMPDLIVMDVGLPGIDGFEATRRIKHSPTTADVSVIMLTARSGTKHLVTAFESGAQEYVVKPFDVAELMARVRTVAHLRQASRELDQLNERLAAEVGQQTSRLKALYEFTRGLNETNSAEEVFDLVIGTIQKLTGSRRISILLKDDTGRFLHCARAAGIDPEVVKSIRLRSNEGIAGSVFTTGKTYVASTYTDNENGPLQKPDRYDTESFISTPLVATSLMTGEETLGVLSITDKPGGGTFTEDEVECIRSVADSAAIALHNHIRRQRLNESVHVLLMTVGRLAEYRDDETGNHLERVREYARILATELQRSSEYSDVVTDEFVRNIYRAAPMHDIGKVGIPDEILHKPGQLTGAEWKVMKEHCRIGRGVLEAALAKTGPVPILTMCAQIAASHHEKFDGNGYPQGLAGKEIPLAARVIALADAYDAITSRRRYKEAMSHGEAVERIRADSGKHFDPAVVEPFLQCADRFDQIRRTYTEASLEAQMVSL